jgi:hypothetical protein
VSKQLEREEEQLERDLLQGVISNAEYRKQMRELQREYRWQAEEAADRAYRDELDRW